MLFEEAVERLAKRLGQRQDLVDDIRFEMQQAQSVTLEQGHLRPWFLLSEDTTAWCDLGDDRMRIPPDFLCEYEESALTLINDDGSIQPLRKELLECLIRKFGEAQSKPIFYALAGSYFRLYPIPSKQWEIRFSYYAKQPDLTDGEENAWLKHASDWLIAETGVVMAAQYLINPEMASIFQQQAQIARKRVWQENEARLHANMSYVKGR